MALWLTQLLAGIFPGVKGNWCKMLTIFSPSCTLRACSGLYRGCFTLLYQLQGRAVPTGAHSNTVMLSLQIQNGLFLLSWPSFFPLFAYSFCYLFRPSLFSLRGILEFQRNTEFISYVRTSCAFHRKFHCRPSSTCECTPPRHRALT